MQFSKRMRVTLHSSVTAQKTRRPLTTLGSQPSVCPQVKKMSLLVLVIVAVLWQCHTASSQEDSGHYIAAVYEHRVMLNPNPSDVCSRQEALEHMSKNLEIFEEQATEAAKQGAQLIVFPEDGIQGFNFTRQSIQGYVESIPDPKSVTWSPCLHPQRFPNTEVLHRLSCMARNNKMYLVANMPDQQECNHSDPLCPPDGRYIFNTDVVFRDDGTLIAKYHKQNLYFEAAFDTPPEYEHVTFDTPFAGKFGIFTCFDILFYEPSITLIEKYKVKQIVYPTAWMNQLPLLSAIQIQQSFATAFGLNFLAANIHRIDLNMTGSGIYTPSHSVHHYDADTEEGRLLVTKVPVLTNSGGGSFKSNVWDVSSVQSHPQSSFCVNRDQECAGPSIPRLESAQAPSSTFHAIMMYDNYTFVPLVETQGDLTVCDGCFCCRVTYQRTNAVSELYSLGAFNGLHTVHGIYYLEVCALVKCADSSWESCGEGVTEAESSLDFHLQGNFTTPYIFPQILASEMQLATPDSTGWDRGSYFMSKKGMSGGLVTAALYGRVYERDHKPV